MGILTDKRISGGMEILWNRDFRWKENSEMEKEIKK